MTNAEVASSHAHLSNLFLFFENTWHILLFFAFSVCQGIYDISIITSHVLCKHSNGERASLINLKLTIGSLLACT